MRECRLFKPASKCLEMLLIYSRDAVLLDMLAECAARLSLLPLAKDAGGEPDERELRANVAGVVLDRESFGNAGEVWKHCESARTRAPHAFVVVVDSVHSPSAEVEAYRHGADHYFTKPVTREILFQRLTSLRERLAAHENATADRKFRHFAGVSLYPDRGIARVSGANLPLTNAEFRILEALSRTPESVIPLETLGNILWGWDSDVYLSHIKCHVSRLRRKLCEADCRAKVIAVRGRGYVLSDAGRVDVDLERAA